MSYFECREGIGSNVKGGQFDVIKELVEGLWVKHCPSKLFMAETFAQHDAAVESYLLIVVSKQKKA